MDRVPSAHPVPGRHGDRRILEENYESSKRWIDGIRSNDPDGVWRKSRGNDDGDWLNGDSLIKEGYPKTGAEVPKEIFATLIYGHSARLLSRMAGVLGKEPDARQYGRLADQIRPRLGGGLEWAKGAYQSIRGPIAVDWKRTGDSVAIDISIPPNTMATVYIPAAGISAVEESGRPIGRSEGVAHLRRDNGCEVFAVGSGQYRFRAR